MVISRNYDGVISRFLYENERLIPSKELQLPLVIEAKNDDSKSFEFLTQFLTAHSNELSADLAQYGAILLRGFDVTSDMDFEKAVLSINGIKGLGPAFMSEPGRYNVDGTKFVLYGNTLYKSGGTMNLGIFHSENYFSTDVPHYIAFCCFAPSEAGGETGLVNMVKVYEELSDTLKEKLENNAFYVKKWPLKQVAERYNVPEDRIEKLCKQFHLPVKNIGSEKYAVMYKPSIFENSINSRKSLQILYSPLKYFCAKIRRQFADDYTGSR